MNKTIKNIVKSSFIQLSNKKKKVLICYMVGGFPNFQSSLEIIDTIIDSGADIIEIGIPFSDPMADGPVIQNASMKALEMGITPKKCFALVKQIKSKHKNTPVLIMTYSNIVFSKNLSRFLSDAKDHYVDGFIIPDLNFEEASEYLSYTKKLQLATVFLTSPNTSNQRIEKIAKVSTGFVYMVSVFGITGSRKKFEAYTFESIKRTKKLTSQYDAPLAVGFGISNVDDARKILNAGADGIIVGSSLIKKISENVTESQEMLNNLRSYIKELKAACR